MNRPRYRVEEIYVGSFWRIRTPEGGWWHRVDLSLPKSFTSKAEAEELCAKLNGEQAEVAA